MGIHWWNGWQIYRTKFTRGSKYITKIIWNKLFHMREMIPLGNKLINQMMNDIFTFFYTIKDAEYFYQPNLVVKEIINLNS